MTIQEFFDKDTSTLSYVAFQGRDAVVIDPVLNFDSASGGLSDSSVHLLKRFIGEKGLTLHWILETHAHADHISSAQLLKSLYPAARIGIGGAIKDVQAIFAKMFNLKIRTDGSQFNHLFRDQEVFKAGAMEFKVHTTPGHTPACVSYECAGNLFTGDAIFMPDSGTGRCDFPGGSAQMLYQSIHGKIYDLPGTTRIFTAHDYQPNGRSLKFSCTISEQMESNIQLRRTTTEAEFVKFRQDRDKTLSAPKLLLPSIQVNIDAGKLPEPEANGTRYLKLPLTETYRK